MIKLIFFVNDVLFGFGINLQEVLSYVRWHDFEIAQFSASAFEVAENVAVENFTLRLEEQKLGKGRII